MHEVNLLPTDGAVINVVFIYYVVKMFILLCQVKQFAVKLQIIDLTETQIACNYQHYIKQLYSEYICPTFYQCAHQFLLSYTLLRYFIVIVICLFFPYERSSKYLRASPCYIKPGLWCAVRHTAYLPVVASPIILTLMASSYAASIIQICNTASQYLQGRKLYYIAQL